MTISLDAEQTKKFRQRFIELKPSTLRTSDEISSFSKLQEISPLKLSCHDFFCKKVTVTISLDTEQTKKFYQRVLELKASTL